MDPPKLYSSNSVIVDVSRTESIPSKLEGET